MQEVIREGLPWSWEEILVKGLLLIGAVVVIGLSVEDHRSQEGRKPLLGTHAREVSVVLILVAVCAVVGFAVGTERAARGDPLVRADVMPTARLAGAMEKLRRAGAAAFTAVIAQSDPVVYASRAHKLGRSFEEVAGDLARLRFQRPGIELAPLIVVLEKLGVAYDRLGNAALASDARPARFEAARRRMERLERRLREVEEDLRKAGLPLEVPPLQGA